MSFLQRHHCTSLLQNFVCHNAACQRVSPNQADAEGMLAELDGYQRGTNLGSCCFYAMIFLAVVAWAVVIGLYGGIGRE